MYFHVKLLVLCSLSSIVSSYVNLPQFHKKEVDKLLRTPFILSSGEFYRDMLTIEAARSVADFAQNQEPENILQPQHFDGLAGLKIPPRFIPSKNVGPGVFQDENDIFDFTASRFLNPPEENKQNHPIMNIMNNFPILATPSPLYGKFIVKPTTRAAKSPIIISSGKKNAGQKYEKFSIEEEDFLPVLSNRGSYHKNPAKTAVNLRLKEK